MIVCLQVGKTLPICALAKKWMGKNQTNIVSQTDIAATVLKQLSINSTAYKWSKDMMDTIHSFAFFDFYDGFGWVTPNGKLIWNKQAGKKYLLDTYTDKAESARSKKQAESYLESLFQEYLNF